MEILTPETNSEPEIMVSRAPTDKYLNNNNKYIYIYISNNIIYILSIKRFLTRIWKDNHIRT